MSGGPLEGVRVVDLTSVVVGPICTRVLADQGADVIKVESPTGDLLRTMALGARNPGMSGKFMNLNRNKRSVALDIKKPEGKEVILRLLAEADVFVTNVRPPALERAGLDYATLKELNPKLVYCGILAFGSDGRYYNQPAYDPIIQSLSGVAGTFEESRDGPDFVHMVMTDHVTGLIAAQNVGFALYRREKTGSGEYIETPMLENMASFVTTEHLSAATFIPPTGPLGDNRLLAAEYKPAPTKDSYITVSPNTDAQAFAFFELIGRPELKTDPRFESAGARTVNAYEYFLVREEGLAQKTTDEWLELFAKADIPAARYNSLEDLFQDPHLNDVGFFEREEHPSEGTIHRTRIPNTFSGGMRHTPLPAPRLGENTAEVLAESGYSATEIREMLDTQVAFEPADDARHQ